MSGKKGFYVAHDDDDHADITRAFVMFLQEKKMLSLSAKFESIRTNVRLEFGVLHVYLIVGDRIKVIHTQTRP